MTMRTFRTYGLVIAPMSFMKYLFVLCRFYRQASIGMGWPKEASKIGA